MEEATNVTEQTEGSAVPTQPAITGVAELEPAIAAPSSEATTHVLVPNNAVDFIRDLASKAKAGDAADLVAAIERVFPAAAA